MMVPSTLLHYFDPSLDKDPSMTKLLAGRVHPVSRELAQRAMHTCLGPVGITPKLRQAGWTDRDKSLWMLALHIDCLVSGDEEDPPVVYFQAKEDLDEDGNVRFIALVPQTAERRARYNVF